MDMGKERLTRGLLLRLGILLTAVCVCVHVYLETAWRGAPAALTQGRPTQPGRAKQVPAAEAGQQDRSVKRRISYVRTLKKEARKRDEDPSSPCCLPRRPHRKALRWHIDLEPWASESHSLEDEAKRFLSYITTPQVSCASLVSKEAAQQGTKGAWAACLDPKYSLTHRIHSKHCRVYSFGLGVDDRSLEDSLARAGCEVHCFDPSLKQPHLQRDDMWLHRLSVDWRDPNPAVVAQRQYTSTKKLATILNDFGHRQVLSLLMQWLHRVLAEKMPTEASASLEGIRSDITKVDVLKADMESAEWKILENLVLEGVLESVGQLLLELHLHWAGFEVGGDDPSVVRFWFSLLKELERANFRLFHVHSNPTKPRLFLHKNVLNASSAYTLSWVNTEWRP